MADTFEVKKEELKKEYDSCLYLMERMDDMNPEEIRKELETMEMTWESISDRLTDYQANSHSPVSSKIAEIQLEYFRKLNLLLKEISVSEMRRSEQQETRMLLAEYTVDNAVYSLKFAEYEMLASIYSQKIYKK